MHPAAGALQFLNCGIIKVNYNSNYFSIVYYGLWFKKTPCSSTCNHVRTFCVLDFIVLCFHSYFPFYLINVNLGGGYLHV